MDELFDVLTMETFKRMNERKDGFASERVDGKSLSSDINREHRGERLSKIRVKARLARKRLGYLAGGANGQT